MLYLADCRVYVELLPFVLAEKAIKNIITRKWYIPMF